MVTYFVASASKVFKIQNVFKLIVYGLPLEIGQRVQNHVAKEKKHPSELSFSNLFSVEHNVKAMLQNRKLVMTLHVQVGDNWFVLI